MKHFERLPEFEKEIKKLSRKFRSLPEDLKTFEQVVLQEPLGIGKNFIVVHRGKYTVIVKARLACRSLQGERALRVIYAYHESTISFVHIELYHKGDKENEDRARYENYIEKVENEAEL